MVKPEIVWPDMKGFFFYNVSGFNYRFAVTVNKWWNIQEDSPLANMN